MSDATKTDEVADDYDDHGYDDPKGFIVVRAAKRLQPGQIALMEDDKRHPDGKARVIKDDPYADAARVYQTPAVSERIGKDLVVVPPHLADKVLAAQEAARNKVAARKVETPARAVTAANDAAKDQRIADLEASNKRLEDKFDALLAAVTAPETGNDQNESTSPTGPTGPAQPQTGESGSTGGTAPTGATGSKPPKGA